MVNFNFSFPIIPGQIMDPTLGKSCFVQLWICIALMLPIAMVNVLLGFCRCELQFDGRRPMLVAV